MTQYLKASFNQSLGFSVKNYTEQAFFNHEFKSIWQQTWQVVGRSEALIEKGSYLTYKLGEENIFVMRLEDGGIKAMHNVCRHRGAKLFEKQGHCSMKIICPYHGWTYNLDGQLIGVTEPKFFPNFDKANFSLVPAQVDTWGGFIFVNPDPNSESLTDYLVEVPAFLEQYDYDWTSLREVSRWFYDEPINWKLIVENYVEDYHFNIVHRQSLNSFDDIEEIRTLPTGRHIRMLVPYAKKQPEGFLKNVWEKGKYSYQAYIFPNFMVHTSKSHTTVFRLTPIAVDRTYLEVIIYQSPEQFRNVSYQREELIQKIDTILKEDLAICRNIQDNLGSRAYEVTQLASEHESGIAHFHKILSGYYKC